MSEGGSSPDGREPPDGGEQVKETNKRGVGCTEDGRVGWQIAILDDNSHCALVHYPEGDLYDMQICGTLRIKSEACPKGRP